MTLQRGVAGGHILALCARLIASGLEAGYAADDGAALHFHNGQLLEVVTLRPKASAYRLELVDGRVVETKPAARFLEAPSG